MSGGDIVRRLLDATDNQFSWVVDKAEMVIQETPKGNLATYWMVRGTLSLGDLGMRSGVGTHPAESVDSAKAAETDALKRAAVKFGVGLHLYEDENSSGANGNGVIAGNGAPPPAPPTQGAVNRGYSLPVANNGGRAGNGYAGSGNRASRPEPDEDGPF